MDALLGLWIALLGGIVTTAVYVVIVWRLDRHEKEPAAMLALAFLWGAVPAVIISVILELAFDGMLGDGNVAVVLSDAGLAPVIEESAKGLALLAFLVFSYRELDGALDGIVYGAMIGFGFALTENVFYVMSGVEEDGLAMGVFILFLRTVVFGINHAFFTSLTGLGVGLARLTRSVPARVVLMSTGWLCAVIFHSVHNLGASLADSTTLLSIGLSLLADWGGVLMVLLIIVLVWRKEQQWISEELADEVATGLLTAEEYVAMSSTAGRQRLLAKTLREAGMLAYRRLRRKYDLLTELAFKKRQVRLVGIEPGMQAEIGGLRHALTAQAGAGTPSTTA
jgi:protease PrsW